MSTTPTIPAPVTPIDINTPAAQIAQVNAESQQTPTPGQPRNADGTFATPQAPPSAAPATPPTPQPFSQEDLGGGRIRVRFVDEAGAETGVYEGTHAELIPKMAEALHKTKQWGYKLNNELSQFRHVTQPQTPPTPATPQSPFADSAEAATANYVIDLVAKSMGLPNGDALREQMGFVTANTTDYAAQTTALAFQASTPDFNPTPENSDKALQVIFDSGAGEAFNGGTRDQQVMLLKQAHAFCLSTNDPKYHYDPKPKTNSAPSLPAPPPPAPSGRTAMPEGTLPENLRATLNDTPEQIKAKWEEARRLGYA